MSEQIATDEEVRNTRKLIAAGYLTDSTAMALPPFLARIEADRERIAELEQERSDYNETATRRIEALADLLAALKRAVDYIRPRVTNPDRGQVGRAMLPDLEAAIAKAEGR